MLDFYKVASVYMFSRLATNVSQVYLTFFVSVTLKMTQTAIAVVPLLVYISSLVATIVMKRIDRRLGRRNSMTLGALLFAGGCIVMIFLQTSSSSLIYPAALLLGGGSAICMVVSVSMEADLVGRNVESAAFLYGAISLTDKLSNGIAVLAIQYGGNGITEPDAWAKFIRYVNAVIPAVAIVLAAFVAWTIKFRHTAPPASSLNPGSVPQQQQPRRGILGKMYSFMRSERDLTTLNVQDSPALSSLDVDPEANGNFDHSSGSSPLLRSADHR